MPVQYWNGLGARKTDKAVDFGLKLIWDLKLVFCLCAYLRPCMWSVLDKCASLTEIKKFPVIDRK